MPVERVQAVTFGYPQMILAIIERSAYYVTS